MRTPETEQQNSVHVIRSPMASRGQSLPNSGYKTSSEMIDHITYHHCFLRLLTATEKQSGNGCALEDLESCDTKTSMNRPITQVRRGKKQSYKTDP